jgi:hypothetical protein
MYTPSELVRALRAKPVSMPVAVTAASPITAPSADITRPRIAPVVVT